MPYLSASAVVIHYEEALYQVYAPLPLHGLQYHLDYTKRETITLNIYYDVLLLADLS